MNDIRRIIAFSLMGLGGVVVTAGIATLGLAFTAETGEVLKVVWGAFCCSSTLLIPGGSLIIFGLRLLPPMRDSGTVVSAGSVTETLRPQPLNDLMRFNALGWTLGGLTAGFAVTGVTLIAWLDDAGRLPFRAGYLIFLLMPALWLFFHGGRLLLKRLGWTIYRW